MMGKKRSLLTSLHSHSAVNVVLNSNRAKKGEATLILWMPNPGFIPKLFDLSEFRSHFRHSREGYKLEFDVSFEIQPLLGVGKVVNRA